jgi:antitoxin (DNA-binding transcriptional repressor) of toxin-antitoxin stability system
MTRINLHEVKSHLSHYARLVKAGQTIILCDRNKPFAEIRPLPDPSRPAPKRKLGLMKGMCPVGPDFFAADEEIARDFEASEIFPAPPASPRP